VAAGEQDRRAFVVERVGAGRDEHDRQRTGGAQGGGEGEVVTEAGSGQDGERAHRGAVMAQDAGHERAVRGVERGVEQRHDALAEEVGDALADHRAGGADHDRAGEVDVVRGGTDFAGDLHDPETIRSLRVHPDGARSDLLVGVDASQTLAHSGCVSRQDDQFARTDQAFVWPRWIMHVHRTEGTDGVIDQLREAVDLLWRVHIGHHPPVRHGPQGTEAQSHSIR
jgi:hypothetical protein